MHGNLVHFKVFCVFVWYIYIYIIQNISYHITHTLTFFTYSFTVFTFVFFYLYIFIFFIFFHIFIMVYFHILIHFFIIYIFCFNFSIIASDYECVYIWYVSVLVYFLTYCGERLIRARWYLLSVQDLIPWARVYKVHVLWNIL